MNYNHPNIDLLAPTDTHPKGIAIIREDTHISKWVKDANRIDHDQWLLPLLFRHVRPGSNVIDVGANIGDHTYAYTNWVGSGTVYAFEPNPVAAICCRHNAPRAIVEECGLADKDGETQLSIGANVGAAHLGAQGHQANTGYDTVTVATRKLDDVMAEYGEVAADFIKIDAEGFECKVLRGAQQFITRARPHMCLEVNSGALLSSGASVNKLLSLIEQLGYKFYPIQPGINMLTEPQYDIICIPQ